MSNELNKDILCMLAQRDLDAARRLAMQRKPPHEIVCYHCQQSTEKTLKGCLDLHEEAYPFIHDLQKLLSLCSAVEPNLEDIRMDCDKLWLISCATHYENPIELTDRDMNQALQCAANIQERVLLHMRELGYTPPEPYKGIEDAPEHDSVQIELQQARDGERITLAAKFLLVSNDRTAFDAVFSDITDAQLRAAHDLAAQMRAQRQTEETGQDPGEER